MRSRQCCPRGPSEHARRDEIVAAAHSHFRRYGYGKTTVSDLAKAIGFSKSYVYKFFDSKQAIGEAICGIRLKAIASDLQKIANAEMPSFERLRSIFQTLSIHAQDISSRETKLQDMVLAAHRERWQPFADYDEALKCIVTKVLEDGRSSQEFERRTPIAEVSRAVLLLLEPFRNPASWTKGVDDLDDKALCLAGLVLRSLSP
jgi:AcrR family transcriptional regulator